MDKNEMKELLVQAWKEVFQVDEVTDDADFFDVGGDSIMAVQLSAWLIQKGVKLDLADVFMTPVFGELAEKLTETKPVYIPEAMLTKEIAAKEMGFSSVEEAQAAERRNLGLGDQQVCTPEEGLGGQQVCTPQEGLGGQQVCSPGEGLGGQQVCSPMGNQQVCTPMGGQQVCTPMGNQQVCSPMGGQQVCTPICSQQVCTPMGNQQICSPMGYQQICMPMGYQQVCTPICSQQVCTPMGNQQVCSPMGYQQICMPMGYQQVCTPMGNQQVCSPMGNQQVCTPMGNQQVCTPMGNQQVCNPAGGPGMVPPQIAKYLSKEVDKPIENPNVIKIEKAKLGAKEKAPDVALMDVMTGLLPNFNKDEDFFEQGLTSLDTVKMVTRCGEAGYDIELKDIYMHSNFDELVKCMK